MRSEDFLTIEEIASLLRVQVSAVRARLARSDASLPPSVRIGGRRLFPKGLYVKWRDDILLANSTKPTSDVPSAPQAFPGQPRSLPGRDLRSPTTPSEEGKDDSQGMK